ncbi:hypothetical protein GGX14DRAFT_670476 [Mycena pura]|uniref:Uncharacterized protein n=1 Tax=Mycena pura TaxID=153505 RepID=A0AAD6VSS8_9AGAR|nr:hypothetical protein GGX14DRAFT_670476 [Mycena pura]
MPPRTRPLRDSTLPSEPLRASVLDVFEQLGAFDQDSGIVEWLFPDVHQERQQRRTRVKLTEIFEDAPEPEPETPRKSRLSSRFFSRSPKSASAASVRSKSQVRTKRDKDKDKDKDVAGTHRQKLKKTRSSPDLRKDAVAETEPPPVPHVSSPTKRARRMSIFTRKHEVPPEQRRSSISDEEWQQITITGSIADYDAPNPFRGHGGLKETNASDVGSTTAAPRRKHFSRFTNGFARASSASTPASPTSTQQRHPSPSSTRSTPASPVLERPAPEPTTPTVSKPPPLQTTHSNVSTDIPAYAFPSMTEREETSPLIHEVSREPETTSQIDHVRMSLSDISEGDVSESSTLSFSTKRESGSWRSFASARAN